MLKFCLYLHFAFLNMYFNHTIYPPTLNCFITVGIVTWLHLLHVYKASSWCAKDQICTAGYVITFPVFLRQLISRCFDDAHTKSPMTQRPITKWPLSSVLEWLCYNFSCISQTTDQPLFWWCTYKKSNDTMTHYEMTIKFCSRISFVLRTGFSMDFPYDPQELIVFSLIGVVCGLGKDCLAQFYTCCTVSQYGS